MSVDIDLTGKVAIVTGGGSGIGRETSVLFGRASAEVVVADIDLAKAEETVALVEKEGTRALAVKVDVSSVDEANAGVAKAIEHFGHVDILVNNAAAWTIKPFHELEFADYVRDVHVSLLGAMVMTRAVYDPMREQKSGVVVNLISDGGRIGEPNLVAYGAAKAGVIGFTKGFAKEAGRYNIRCNAVSPGTTRTPASTEMVAKWGGEERIVKGYTIRRLGEPIDQANAILFFASDQTSWVTGQILSVSGGFTMVD
jgi:NAD(P)-dependent dehydrogenase (short-subunit alcohol dehydrogenase family)